jgi:hypothetical protein
MIFLANRMSSGQARCSQSSCQNGATCQEQGLNALCICKPGFTGQQCESGIFFDHHIEKN